MACGRLGDRGLTGPYRTDTAIVAAEVCRHCGRPELADLASGTTALALADELERDRSRRGPRAIRWVGRLAAVTLAIVGLGCFTLTVLMLAVFGFGRGWQVARVLAAMLVILFGGPGMLLAARAIRRLWRRTTPRALPARWRFCLPEGRDRGGGVEASVVCEGASLTAPISGRPCVAFEVGLREDDDGAVRLGTWLLMERRSAALRVGDVSLASDGVGLELVRRPIAWPSGGPDRERAAGYLRSRGFVVGEAVTLRLFEAVLVDRELVEVVATTPPTLRAREQGAAGGGIAQ